MSKVLIVTFTDDNACIEQVTEALGRHGAQAIRFNTDLYPGQTALTVDYRHGQWRQWLHTAEGTHDLTNIEAVWYRRLRIGKQLKGTMDEEYLGPAIDESRRTFMGFMAGLDCFVFDPVWRVRYAEVKQVQLKIAQQVGLNIPMTQFSNHEADVQAFYGATGEQMITKMQASFAINRQGQEHVVFTNAVTAADVSNLEGLALCPMQFQQKIEKQVELRITIVGDRVFAASVDSQASGKSDLDWRKDGTGLIDQWQPYDLPNEVAQKLLRLMDYLQLNYGAADMIVTPDGQYYFLEVNPVGEYFWLDKAARGEFPISETIAEVLLGKRARRSLPYHKLDA